MPCSTEFLPHWDQAVASMARISGTFQGSGSAGDPNDVVPLAA